MVTRRRSSESLPAIIGSDRCDENDASLSRVLSFDPSSTAVLALDTEVITFENLPDLAPVSDNSASTASFHESLRSQASDCSDDEDGRCEDESSVELSHWTVSAPLPVATPTTSRTASRTKKSCRVTWGTVEFRLHPIVPGDHPDCWVGPPLTIAWHSVGTVQKSVDDFEAQRKDRKLVGELRLNWLDRRRILRCLGATEQEMSDAVERSHKVRTQRQKSHSWSMRMRKVEKLQHRILRSLGRSFHPRRSR